MKNAGKLKTALLTCAAAALVLGGSLGTSMSYFTTYATAKGQKELHLTIPKTDIEEHFEGTTKQVTVRNTEDAPCYVRVMVFSPIDCTIEGDGWRPDSDGYYYYANVLENEGDAASVLNVKPISLDGVTEDFEIEVVVEAAPVFYETDENGNTERLPNGPDYKGWNLEGKIREETQG